MFKFKKLSLLLASVGTVATLPMVAASCSKTEEQKDKGGSTTTTTKLTQEAFQAEVAKITLAHPEGFDAKKYYPEQITKELLKFENVATGITISEPTISQNLNDGKVTVGVSLSYEGLTNINKSFTVSGLKNNLDKLSETAKINITESGKTAIANALKTKPTQKFYFDYKTRRIVMPGSGFKWADASTYTELGTAEITESGTSYQVIHPEEATYKNSSGQEKINSGLVFKIENNHLIGYYRVAYYEGYGKVPVLPIGVYTVDLGEVAA